MKIVFFGTGNFGLPALEMLAKNFDVLKVFTGFPKNAGRGKKLLPNSIDLKAKELDLSVFHTEKPVLQDLPEEFDFGIVVSYGAIIKEEVLRKAKYCFLNIHPSDLPNFRGASPIERTVEAGHEKTRICVIKMTPRLDDGEIVSFQNYQIQPDENSLTLHKKFAEIGAGLLKEAIEKIKNGESTFEVQSENFTYAKKIKKEELELKPNILTCEEAINKIRAFPSYGYPFIFFKGKRIKFLQAESSSEIKTPIDLPCKNGFLTPLKIKLEGKKEVNIKDFLNSLTMSKK